MRRTVLASAELSGDALNELKQWLGISRDNEDVNLVTLLKASLDICEGFTGQRLLEAEFEEIVDLNRSDVQVSTRPVQSVLSVDLIDELGQRTAAEQSAYSATIRADGTAYIKLTDTGTSNAIAARFTAGMSSVWADLPGALRHGIIRLAAFHYRERDSAKPLQPPASVTALWKPWRRMRLT